MNSIPESNTLINILLSKLQKKTPTIVHKQFSIQKIRQFYFRKIKFFQQEYQKFIEKISKSFPLIDQLHPFFGNLFNILFNRDNYKLALYQLYKSKKKIEEIAKKHLKFLKYGKSLYNCKQIKKIALGKMCKKIKKIKNSLKFLEKIRIQLKIIPRIDPHRKTIILGGTCGVGKSSILNKITAANVFFKNNECSTTSLILGHLTFKFFRWQILDTPAIKSVNFKFLNSIEMLSINAFVNLDCIIIYIVDFSLNNYNLIEKQIDILQGLKKIFKKKKKNFILSKTDLGWEKKMNIYKKTILTNLNNFDVRKKFILKNSSHDEIGLISVKKQNFFLKIHEDKLTPQVFFFSGKKKNLVNNFKNYSNFQKINKGDIYGNLKEKRSNNIILSINYRRFILKNFFSYNYRKTKKKTSQGEKHREYKNEEQFALKKINNLFFYLKNFKFFKIFQKNFYCLKPILF
jgi:nucleolar GTP-binding protein